MMKVASGRFGGALAGRATPAPDSEHGIDALRRRGVVLMAAAGWLSLIPIALARVMSPGTSWLVLLIGVAANLAPTAMAWRQRHDAEARATVATLAAIMPALLVYALRSHPWQMDAHMYFFVALAALTMLCDWKPIVLASAMIAAHHLVLEIAVPEWVFAGRGNIGRVGFHAVAVVMQSAVLCFITVWLGRLLTAQDAAMQHGERLVLRAEEERARADAALRAAQDAGAEAETARRQHRAATERLALDRRAELLDLAADFERSVAGIAVAIELASTKLAGSAEHLDDLSQAAQSEAVDVASTTRCATAQIRHVAEAISSLNNSIGSIAAAAEQQRELTSAGSAEVTRSGEKMATLVQCAEQIAGFIDEIRAIASKTNLLALNATIEASRAGDAGRGFAVVAQEVKGLAADTERASSRIVDILRDVRNAVAASTSDARAAFKTVDHLSEAATSIAVEAIDQRRLASAIESNATRAAGNAEAIGDRVERLASSVAAAVSLSSTVRNSSSALSANARELKGSSERFVQHLRDDHAIAALADLRAK